jgi:hypothetical protein
MDEGRTRRTLAALALIALSSCDPGWSLGGFAHSETGAPIPGATAETVCPTDQAPLPKTTADSNGEFRGKGLGNFRDDCVVEVRADGFAPRSFPVGSVCTKQDRYFGCLAVNVRATLARCDEPPGP